MITLKDCAFKANGANKKDKVYALKVEGTEDVRISNSTFEGTGYSAIANQTAGNVSIKNCSFSCDGFYNPVECSTTVNTGNMVIADCDFKGSLGNNFINVYNAKDNARVDVLRCAFSGGTTDNNIIRVSNRSNTTLSVSVEDSKYSYASGTPGEYTGFMVFQDYTNKTGTKQDFSKCHVDVKNLTKPDNYTRYYYVYEDDKGIITDNNPSFYVDGVNIA